MNADKAREFFSAYYEGTLDRGLMQSLERQLASDATVQAEYRAFQATMSQLESLRAEPPEPAFDLHDRITARLDLHLLQVKRRPGTWYSGRWRSVFVAGVCCLALIGAVPSLRTRSGSFVAGAFGWLTPNKPALVADELTVIGTDGEIKLRFRTGDERVVVLRMASTGQVLKWVRLDGRDMPKGVAMESPLHYASSKPTLLLVQLLGEPKETLIALPGRERQVLASGRGNLGDLAVALAGYYQTTVVIDCKNVQPVTWDFRAQEALGSATEALKGTDCSASQRSAGVIWIQ